MKKTQQVMTEATNPYLSAAREFLKGTFSNPEFFTLSSEEQRKVAMDTIQKHKSQIKLVS